MGRGRAKAKQTKVARALKYYSPSTDLSALEQELHGSGQTRPRNKFVREADRDRSSGHEDDDEHRWASGQD